eukprot:3000086-Rhodomonas_salina.2
MFAGEGARGAGGVRRGQALLPERAHGGHPRRLHRHHLWPQGAYMFPHMCVASASPTASRSLDVPLYVSSLPVCFVCASCACGCVVTHWCARADPRVCTAQSAAKQVPAALDVFLMNPGHFLPRFDVSGPFRVRLGSV